MTRERAIEVLKRMKTCMECVADWTCKECDEAFEMAIKALEQEPDAIHNEREQAYMKGYEDASKRYRTEPCEDVISRSDAIRVASGYCHWSNIPEELAKLPSVNTIPCEDAISRQAAIDVLKNLSGIDGKNVFEKYSLYPWNVIKELPSVSMTGKTGRWKRRIVDSGYNADWSCSCCGYKVKTDFVNFKYCPECGSRNGEVGESE